MTSADTSSAAVPSPPPAADRPGSWTYELLAVALLGLVLGLSVRGHFIMPYADFMEQIDSGHALWQGELPATLKRAPVYPLLIVGIGRLLPVEAADQHVAEWLNALLLSLNGVLVCLLARRWCDRGARWVAAWFLLLPLGLLCTAHVILEPLLATLLLATLLLAQRHTRWAYALAGLAAITRYDLAGLIVGLALVDLLRHEPRRRVLLRTLTAAAPLLVWLILTGLTWSSRSGDHYLLQIAQDPRCDLFEELRRVMRAAFPADIIATPGWLDQLDRPLRLLLGCIPPVLALVGLVLLLRRARPTALLIIVAGGGYLLVHAVFPFHFDRFAYPLVALPIILAGAGIAAVWRWCAQHAPSPAMLRCLLLFGLLVVVVLLCARIGLRVGSGDTLALGSPVRVLTLLAIVLLWLPTAPADPRRLAPLTGLVALVLLAVSQLDVTRGRLGTGQELRNQIVAARWVRQSLPDDARVLSAMSGVLRLYVGRQTPDRFPSYADLAAQTWPEVVAECRQRGITHIIWHDALDDLHGGYYAAPLGLDRFAPLSDAATAPGVEPVHWFRGQPNVVIVQVFPAPATD